MHATAIRLSIPYGETPQNPTLNSYKPNKTKCPDKALQLPSLSEIPKYNVNHKFYLSKRITMTKIHKLMEMTTNSIYALQKISPSLHNSSSLWFSLFNEGENQIKSSRNSMLFVKLLFTWSHIYKTWLLQVQVVQTNRYTS